jgi:hypothetical protein
MFSDRQKLAMVVALYSNKACSLIKPNSAPASGADLDLF